MGKIGYICLMSLKALQIIYLKKEGNYTPSSFLCTYVNLSIDLRRSNQHFQGFGDFSGI